jgi:hypothetical protein
MTLLQIRDKYYSNKPHYYLSIYEQYLAKLVEEPIALLELGVHRGGSLEMWAEFFPKGTIVGIDLKDIIEVDLSGKPLIVDGKTVIKQFSSDRIVSRKGSQADRSFLNDLSAECAPGGWDIVMDDCSHVGELSLASFLSLFPLLKVGGLYIVEDWGVGYSTKFPDGARFSVSDHFTSANGHFPSHQSGLAGFVKQFIDEVGIDDIRHFGDIDRPSAFEWVHYYKGAVIIKKRQNVPHLRSADQNASA